MKWITDIIFYANNKIWTQYIIRWRRLLPLSSMGRAKRSIYTNVHIQRWPLIHTDTHSNPYIAVMIIYTHAHTSHNITLSDLIYKHVNYGQSHTLRTDKNVVMLQFIYSSFNILANMNSHTHIHTYLYIVHILLSTGIISVLLCACLLVYIIISDMF